MLSLATNVTDSRPYVFEMWNAFRGGGRSVSRIKEKLFMYKALLTVLLFVILFSTSPSQTGNQFSSLVSQKAPLKNDLNAYLSKAADFGFSGVVLVARDGKVVSKGAYGFADRKRKLSNTLNTVFYTCSITKHFTAAAIMKLEMQGKLKTDDTIDKFLDNVPADKAKVKIHQLLTHTAGFPEYSGPDHQISGRDETIKRILDTPLDFAPGTSYSYSNAGYSFLAYVVEKASGQDYETYLNTHLFKPAGMMRTGYVLPKYKKSTLPRGYVENEDKATALDHPWSPKGPYWNLLGNGGMLSTIDDMFKWYQALQSDKILSKEAKAKMFTPARNNYGYAWNINDTKYGKAIGHNGSNDFGFSAHLRWFPEKNVCIIVMSNAGEYLNIGNYSNVLAKKVTNLAFGGQIPSQSGIRPSSQVVQQTKKFEGVYRLDSGGELEVKEQSGQLMISALGQDATNLLGQNASQPILDDLNSKAISILSGIVKTDYKSFNSFFDRPDVATRSQTFLEKRIKDWETKDGAVTGFQIPGTVLDWWADESAPVTFVTVKNEKANHIFRLHWKDGKLFGIGGDGIPNPVSTPLMPISRSEFEGWHISFAKPIRVKFESPATGQQQVVVTTGRKSITAVKMVAR
jgi:CubicO group peptidase (beta-lactamase class C family)